MTHERCKVQHPRAPHILCVRAKNHEESKDARDPERHISERGQWWTEEIEAAEAERKSA